VSTEEDRRTLVACIHRLPKTQATVIVLHYLQSVPLCEVARLLDVSAARVSQIHRRAVERLRQVWAVGLESA
jgi:RNA polymerase sigma factor for flagellar operon FliA